MKKKWKGPAVAMGVFCCVILIGVFAVRLRLSGVADTQRPESEAAEIRPNAEGSVIKGKLPRVCTSNGTVTSPPPEECETEIFLSGTERDRFTLIGRCGEDIGAGDTLCQWGEEDIRTGCRARLIDVEEKTENGKHEVRLRLLNYEKLEVLTYVSESYLKTLSYETEATVTIDGMPYESKITEIGDRVGGGMIPVKVALPANRLPGDEAKVDLTLGTAGVDGLWMLQDFFFRKNGEWYTYVKENGKLVERKVRLGETFFDEDGIFVEILDGLNAHEKIYMEMRETTGEDLLHVILGGERS